MYKLHMKTDEQQEISLVLTYAPKDAMTFDMTLNIFLTLRIALVNVMCHKPLSDC